VGVVVVVVAVDTRTNMTCPVTFCVINKCLSLSRPVVGRDRQTDRQTDRKTDRQTDRDQRREERVRGGDRG
jgi:hypothetical protein